jgi:hypothetical protein
VSIAAGHRPSPCASVRPGSHRLRYFPAVLIILGWSCSPWAPDQPRSTQNPTAAPPGAPRCRSGRKAPRIPGPPGHSHCLSPTGARWGPAPRRPGRRGRGGLGEPDLGRSDSADERKVLSRRSVARITRATPFGSWPMALIRPYRALAVAGMPGQAAASSGDGLILSHATHDHAFA